MLRRSFVAGCLALALFALAVQQHHHARVHDAGCVACTVRALRATPAETPAALREPILLAEAAPLVELLAPAPAAVPVPRAQGPPAA